MELRAVTRRRPDEGEHNGQQDRGRLGPRRRAVEHKARVDRTRDDRGNQNQRGARNVNAGLIERIHRLAEFGRPAPSLAAAADGWTISHPGCALSSPRIWERTCPTPALPRSCT